MSDGSNTTVAARPLRRDAERNRVRILASAKVLIAEHGVDVSLDDIARHAGVGVGTVYRRFPDRQALIADVSRFLQRRPRRPASLRLAIASLEPIESDGPGGAADRGRVPINGEHRAAALDEPSVSRRAVTARR